MAGRFSEQFAQQLGSLSSFRMPQGREMETEEDRLLKRSQIERNQLDSIANRDAILRKQEQDEALNRYSDMTSKFGYIPDTSLPEAEQEQNARIDAQQEHAAFIKAFPDSKVSFEDFYQSSRKKGFEARKAQEDITLTQAQTGKAIAETEKARSESPLKLGLSSDELRQLETANQSGTYKDVYNKFVEAGKIGIPSPNQSQTDITKQLLGSKSYEYDSNVAKAGATGAQALAQIEDFGTYAETKDENGKTIRLDKRLNSENKEDVNDLRTEYQSQIKPLNKGLSEVKLSRANLSKKDSKGGIQGLEAVNAIYRHMKGLDESGAVREGDIALFLSSLGLADVAEGKIQSWTGGTYLKPETVKAIESWLSNQENTILNSKKETENKVKNNAIFRGIHPKLIDSSIEISNRKAKLEQEGD